MPHTVAATWPSIFFSKSLSNNFGTCMFYKTHKPLEHKISGKRSKKVENKVTRLKKLRAYMEANCYPAQTRRARMFLVLTVMMAFMEAAQGNTEEVIAAGAPEGSLICISKCGTCPATCAAPPPPPPPTPTPQTPSSPPPPPSKANPSPPAHAPPPPPTQGQQGSRSNPYYYFYTSEATCKHSLPGLLRLFPMILFFSLSMLLQ